ncbi:hypothetical protein QN363_20080, partial [Undibacterium sp. CCC2.1]|uniref:hypothetical protein n=1 Tax=Undibacterium sp. CCC2.1 TaxID=3048604 RepID=UPI002B231EE5
HVATLGRVTVSRHVTVDHYGYCIAATMLVAKRLNTGVLRNDESGRSSIPDRTRFVATIL